MATLEQQIESQKEAAEKTKAATVSAADLAAERAAKAVLGNFLDQVGAKFQGDLPSEPTYDLLREADETIAKLKQQVGTLSIPRLLFDRVMGSIARAANKLRSRRREPTRNTAWATEQKPMGSSSLSTTG